MSMNSNGLKVSPKNSGDLPPYPATEQLDPEDVPEPEFDSTAKFEAEMEQKFNGVFYGTDGRKHLFSVTSLYCMSQHNLLRHFCVSVITNKWFDRFITLSILINSALLASKEYEENYDANYVSNWNEFLDTIDFVFSYIFLAECILKVIGMGFVRHKHAYLKDPWNCIDFTIVVFSMISMTPLSSEKSLKVFRTARILRPLRSMHQLKSMRSLLQTFLSSIPGLVNVCVFQFFIFSIFAILGVNLFVGNQYKFCRATEEPLPDGSWPINEEANWQCSSDDMCRGPPNVNLEGAAIAKCGDVYSDYGLDPVINDNAYESETINFDITNFNSVLNAIVLIFQAITLEGWSSLMYSYMDTSGSLKSSIYFIFLVIIGAFTTLNLILAAIMHSYLEQEAKEKEKEVNSKENLEKNTFENEKDATMLVSQMRLMKIQTNQDQPNTTSKRKDLSIIEEAENGSVQRNSLLIEDVPQQQSFQVNGQDFVLQQDQMSVARNSNSSIEHLPQMHGQTMSRFHGIQEHQALEARAMAEPMVLASQESYHSREYSSGMRYSKVQDNSHQDNHSDANVSILESPAKSNAARDQFANLSPAHSSGQEVRIQEKAVSRPQSQILMNSEIKLEAGRMSSAMTSSALSVPLDKSQIAAEICTEERASRNCCYRFFFEIVMSVTFNFLIYCFIIANTITLAMYRFDQSDSQARLLEICDIIFVWVFTAELIAKLIGLGAKVYCRDKFNLFDGLIVVISLVDFTLSLTIDMDSAAGIMSAMRALRLLRVIKLARHWTAFQEILTTMINSLVDISSFSVLLALVLFIFALLGMEMFAYSVYEDAQGELVFGKENIQAAYERGDVITWPRQNFNNIFNSFLTVFIVIVAEDWNAIMYLYVRALSYDGGIGRQLAITFFLSLFIIGNTIMLALFTALLLKSQEVDMNLLTAKIEEKETKKLKKTLSLSQEQINAHPCKKLTKACSRTACSNCFDRYADSFVRIFGGEHAFNKRRKMRKQKDPRSNASPISGNAIAPVAQQVETSLQQRQDPQSKDFNIPIADQSDEASEKESIDEASIAIKSQENFEQSKPLQRPHALLHYDTDQVKQVSLRGFNTKETIELKGRSLYMFKPDNCLRKVCQKVSGNGIFDSFIIVCILASTASLALEHPLEDPNSEKMETLNKIDLVFTGIFCFEAALKIISLGFIMNGSDSYLLNSWNILDFGIVALSLVSLTVDAKLSVIKVLRVARILRPLRLIQKAEGLKVAIQALFKSVPQIMRLQTVVLFFMFMISILMTSLLSGKMFHCNLEHTGLQFQQQEALVANKWDCLNYGGIWETATLNFDNTLQGMLTLFIFQTREGWVGLMDDSIDSVGVDYVGVRGSNTYFIFFYIFMVIILCLLFTNMFVRIVIQTYNMEKDFLSFNRILTDQQRSWIQVQLMTYSIKPQKMLSTESRYCFRNLMIKIAQSRAFENFIMAAIILNTLIMALIWFDQPDEVGQATEIMNYVFMTIFTIEACIKLVALKSSYFSDSWNIFDFTIVAMTLIILSLKMAGIKVPLGNGPMILRALRIGRILRLIKKARQLLIIFHTLIDSSASLGSLGLLLIIVFFMFAIIGRSIFGHAKIGDPNEELNEHANFRDFGTSFLLLLRCSTGESWHMIMFETAKSYAPNYQCRENEDYDSIMANGGEPFACGSKFMSYAFFILFNLLVMQIFINLFVAIIIDAFLGQTDHFSLPLQKFNMQAFVDIWSQYDPKATGFIAVTNLNTLIRELAESIDGSELVIFADDIKNDTKFRREFICFLDIPLYDQFKKVMFYDVLQQLADKVNLMNFNEKHVNELQVAQNAVQKLTGRSAVKDARLAALTRQSENSQFDFEQTVRNMGRLNPKIKLMMHLQACFIGVHYKYAIYADTEKTLNLTDKERRALPIADLQLLIEQGKISKDDVNLYTTKHHHYGFKLQAAMRRALARKKRMELNQESPNKEDTAHQRNSNMMMQSTGDSAKRKTFQVESQDGRQKNMSLGGETMKITNSISNLEEIGMAANEECKESRFGQNKKSIESGGVKSDTIDAELRRISNEENELEDQ